MKEIISGLALARNAAALSWAAPGLGIVQIAEWNG